MEEAVAGPASDRRDGGKGIPRGKHDLLRRRELEGAGHSGQRARRKTVHASGGLSARVSEGGEHGSEDLRGGGSLLQGGGCFDARIRRRSEEHTSELQSLMRISYAVFCWN